MYEGIVKKMKRLNHDCFRISLGGKVIYTDPFKLEESPGDADIILISHDHFDHLSIEDIEKVSKDDTKIVANFSCKGTLKGKVIFMKPGDRETVEGISVEAVPAYNVHPERLNFHPREKEYCGFIFSAEEVSVYFAGDTDHIPEMKDFNCNIALLPVSGTYVMTPSECVDAAIEIKPDIVVPMHFGAIVGTRDDAYQVMNNFPGKTIII